MLERGVFSLLHTLKKLKGGQEDQILFVGANSKAHSSKLQLVVRRHASFSLLEGLYGSIIHSRTFSAGGIKVYQTKRRAPLD
jgi:hypothetical protein